MQRGSRPGACLSLAEPQHVSMAMAHPQPRSRAVRAAAPRQGAMLHHTPHNEQQSSRAVRCAARSVSHFLATKSGKQSANAALGCLLSLCSFSFDSEEVQMKGCRQILHCAA